MGAQTTPEDFRTAIARGVCENGGTMPDSTESFGQTAKSLARNPLGIIALFIVLVYGIAGLVTAFSGSFAPGDRQPLIYFLVGFPVLVLVIFTWLVANHSGKLYSPSDFKDEKNWVQMQLEAVASLSMATAKSEPTSSGREIQQIINVVSGTKAPKNDGWKNQILWVDDRPENNIYERRAFEAIGLSFALALSTNEAFEQLENRKFAAIISDMGRKEGPREGYVLLDRLRHMGDKTPLFFYAASNAPEHKAETARHGGQGCTNNAQELFEMVTRCVMGGS